MKPERKQQTRSLGRAQTLGLAAAAGTAAALLAGLGLTRQPAGTRAQAQTAPVVTVIEGLSPRTLLSAGMLRVIRLPLPDIPSGTFSRINQVIGQVTTDEINIGQPLTKAEVTTRDETDGIAPQIPATLRAVSIPLDSACGAAGFLEPGDHVDVLASSAAADGQIGARVVVCDARLLALNARPDAPATSGTLEVTPRAALALASAQGHLTLALRGLGDAGQVDSADPPHTLAAPPSAAPKPALPAPPASLPEKADLPAKPPPAPQILVVRGTQTTRVTVGD